MERLPSARLAALLLAAALPARAEVQPVLTRFDVDHLRPPALAECSLVVGCAEVGAPRSFRLALAATASSHPLVYRDGGHLGGGGYGSPTASGDVLTMRGGLRLSLAYAALDGLEVSGSLPFVAAQSGNDLTNQAVHPPASWGTGTPALGLRWSPLQSTRGAPLSLAVALDALAPVGWKQALAGNSQLLLAPRLEAARWTDDAVFTAEVGLLRRGRDERLGVERLGSEVTWGLAVAGRPAPLRGEFAVRGWLTRGAGAGIETLVGIRVQSSELEWFALAGPGFGRAPGTPDLRGMAGVAWTGSRPRPSSSAAGDAP